MDVLTSYQAYFAGQWQESESQETIEIRSPWRHEVIGSVQSVTQNEVDQAIAAAHRVQGSWANLSMNERG